MSIRNIFKNKADSKTASREAENPEQKHAASLNLKPLFKGEVLICEDNILNQDYINNQVKNVGFNTTIVSNGKECVDIVSHRINNGEKQFDLILMDIQMPIMDGLEATAILKKLNVKAPIIALTANTEPKDIETYNAAGMNSCLAKPVTYIELWKCLEKFFTPISHQQAAADERALQEEKQKIKLYSGFVRRNKSTYSDICEAVKAGDIKLAHRLAHTLRGLAGLMGKKELQEAAGTVEHSLSGGDASSLSNESMDILNIELNKVLDELAEFQEKPKVEPSPKEWDRQFAKELFDDLEELLNADNAKCRLSTDALRTLPGTGELIEQIEEYEFEAALSILAGLRKKLEV